MNSKLHLEDNFNNILSIERKRAERSGKSFWLMLLDIEALLKTAKEKEETIKKISDTLFLTRETDFKGWYIYDSVLGIIFTEVNGSGQGFVKQKVRSELCNVLGTERADKIGISFHVFPDEQIGDERVDKKLYPDLSKNKKSRKACLAMKRIIDICGSIFGLITFLPFLMVIPVLIKATSRGPIFFRQTRLGKFGKQFTFLKFRTMYVGNDSNVHKEYIKKFIREQSHYSNGQKDKKNVYKISDDPRITPLGRILRKTSLDELPQLFNVLAGDMSLVGPRPPIPYEIENYHIWHKRRVIEIKPGITGLWQVEGRSSTTFDEMVRLDLKYIRDWSLWLDLKILIRTPLVVILGKGAY